MNNIEIDCSCGNTLKTNIDKEYDVMMHGEGSYTDEVTCLQCQSKYRITLTLDIIE